MCTRKSTASLSLTNSCERRPVHLHVCFVPAAENRAHTCAGFHYGSLSLRCACNIVQIIPHKRPHNTCIHAHVYIYIHTYIHTLYIHTYIHVIRYAIRDSANNVENGVSTEQSVYEREKRRKPSTVLMFVGRTVGIRSNGARTTETHFPVTCPNQTRVVWNSF